MPNHIHFVLYPNEDGQLSDFMRRLTGTHAVRWHAHYGTTGSGHVYQNRFRSFPVERNFYYLVVLRYVERNALRAGLVGRAEDWRWGSLWVRDRGPENLRRILAPSPVDLPADWVQTVNQPQSNVEREAMRRAIRRSTPYGTAGWTARIVKRLGLEWTLRPRGRPIKIVPAR